MGEISAMLRNPASLKFALGLLTTLLLAPVEAVIAQELRGLLVYGHEVHTLQPCGDKRIFWLRAPKVGQELAMAYQHLATYPYEPVYAVLEVALDDQPASEFAADYDGTIAIHAITSLSREQVAACRDGIFEG